MSSTFKKLKPTVPEKLVHDCHQVRYGFLEGQPKPYPMCDCGFFTDCVWCGFALAQHIYARRVKCLWGSHNYETRDSENYIVSDDAYMNTYKTL